MVEVWRWQGPIELVYLRSFPRRRPTVRWVRDCPPRLGVPSASGDGPSPDSRTRSARCTSRRSRATVFRDAHSDPSVLGSPAASVSGPANSRLAAGSSDMTTIEQNKKVAVAFWNRVFIDRDPAGAVAAGVLLAPSAPIRSRAFPSERCRSACPTTSARKRSCPCSPTSPIAGAASARRRSTRGCARASCSAGCGPPSAQSALTSIDHSPS